MGFASDDEALAHEQVVNATDDEELSHELIVAAASYDAGKAYERHRDVAQNGKPDSHEEATEILTASSGDFIDCIVATKGLNHIDTRKAKHEARKQAEEDLTATGEY